MRSKSEIQRIFLKNVTSYIPESIDPSKCSYKFSRVGGQPLKLPKKCVHANRVVLSEPPVAANSNEG